jgi:hypothetical protein
MILINEGTIIATGASSLDIDSGTNVAVNSGTLQGTGSGGLVIHSDVVSNDHVNLGLLWANGGHGLVTCKLNRKYGFMVLCQKGQCHENYCRAFG